MQAAGKDQSGAWHITCLARAAPASCKGRLAPYCQAQSAHRLYSSKRDPAYVLYCAVLQSSMCMSAKTIEVVRFGLGVVAKERTLPAH